MCAVPPPPPPGDALFLLDAMGIVYRSYHALANVTFSSRALPDTRAAYGFTLVLLSLLAGHARGARVAAVFEGRPSGPGAAEPDFRTREFPAYKSTRAPTPDGVREAVPWVKRVVRALGCAVVEVGCYEADDVIGTLVARAGADAATDRCVVVSSDKDFRQLLDAGAGVVILRPVSRARGGGGYEYVDEDAFRAEFEGIAPRSYVDVLALLGDKVDNVPGVPGIGAKTAPRLIARYGGLEELLGAVAAAGGAAVPGVSRRQAQQLVETAELARLSRRLVTIKEDVAMPGFEWGDLARARVDRAAVAELCDQLEFDASLRQRMLAADESLVAGVGESTDGDGAGDSRAGVGAPPGAMDSASQASVGGARGAPAGKVEPARPPPPPPPPPAPELVYRSISCAAAAEVEAAAAQLTADCRGTGAEEGGALGIAAVPAAGGTAEGIALSARPGVSWYFALAPGAPPPAPLLTLLRDESVEKRGWALKETVKLLRDDVRGRLFDMRISCDLMWAGQSRTDAAFIAHYLGADAVDAAGAPGGPSKNVAVAGGPAAALAAADFAARLGDAVQRDLDGLGVSHVADKVEFPLIRVLAEMELAGVPFDACRLEAVRAQVDRQVGDLEEQLLALVPADVKAGGPKEEEEEDGCERREGRPGGAVGGDSEQTGKRRQAKRPRRFSLTSRDDVAKLLFETWAIPVKSKTSGGKATTDRRALVSVAEDAGLPANQRTFAALMLKHREVSKLASTYTRSLSAAISPAGRIHATFVQDASASGRLSTSSPNLQSIPVRSALGRSIREAVTARPGFSIITADYSQVELRILAALSGDAAMVDAFAANSDIHTAVASRIFHTASPTPAQRSRAKAVSFGIPYGISAYGLSQELSVPVPEARALIRDFFAAYPGVRALTLDLVSCAREVGYAETLCGRRLYLPLLSRGGALERRAAERVAMNMPIQGTQADMIKGAMVAVARRLKDIGRGRSALVLQVHDELVVEAEGADLDAVVHCVCEEMCAALPLPGGLDVVVNVGVGQSWLEAAGNAKMYGPAARRHAGSQVAEPLARSNV